MRKLRFSTELAYLVGIVLLAFSTAMMEKADFGLSMVVAPAYLVYLKLSQTLPFFTFGMAEYLLQGLLLVAMMLLLRRFRMSYLFSFVTAVFYGLLLDGSMALIADAPTGVGARLAFFFCGFVLCATGVAFVFRTYIAPEAYELFVKTIAAAKGKNVNRVKMVYDCVSCAVGIVLSFCFFGFGHLEGVKLGTVFCALMNGTTIGLIGKGLDRLFTFVDVLPLRKYFED